MTCWVYMCWVVDEKKLTLKRSIWFFGLGHANRILNMEVAPEGFAGTSYNPQARFEHDPDTNPLMPRVGAGVYLSLGNLLILCLSYYFIAHLTMASLPYATTGHTWRFVPIALALAAVSVVTASCSVAFLLYCFTFKSYAIFKIKLFSAAIFFLALLGWSAFLRSSGDVQSWRLDFERITNLPNGGLAGFSGAFPDSGARRVDLLAPGPPPSLPVVVPTIFAQGGGAGRDAF